MMNLPRFLLPALFLSVPILLPSCGTTGKDASRPAASAVPVEEMTGYFEETGFIPGHLLKWEDDPSLPGRLLIVVDKKKQMMYVYRGTRRIAYSPVSSGKRSGMTPAGSFRISSKDKDHHSYYGSFISPAGEMRDGDIRKDSPRPGERFEAAKMPYFMRVNGAVGMHEGYMPGRPSSHGCIRLPHMIAKNLFEAAPVGTHVIVSDGGWNIHDLQKKPDSHFRTVHRPAPAGAGENMAGAAGGNSSSPRQEEPLKSEQSAEKKELKEEQAVPSAGGEAVAEAAAVSPSASSAEISPPSSDQ